MLVQQRITRGERAVFCRLRCVVVPKWMEGGGSTGVINGRSLLSCGSPLSRCPGEDQFTRGSWSWSWSWRCCWKQNQEHPKFNRDNATKLRRSIRAKNDKSSLSYQRRSDCLLFTTSTILGKDVPEPHTLSHQDPHSPSNQLCLSPMPYLLRPTSTGTAAPTQAQRRPQNSNES